MTSDGAPMLGLKKWVSDGRHTLLKNFIDDGKIHINCWGVEKAGVLALSPNTAYISASLSIPRPHTPILFLGGIKNEADRHVYPGVYERGSQAKGGNPLHAFLAALLTENGVLAAMSTS